VYLITQTCDKLDALERSPQSCTQRPIDWHSTQIECQPCTVVLRFTQVETRSCGPAWQKVRPVGD